jgi:hypothetical protein
VPLVSLALLLLAHAPGAKAADTPAACAADARVEVNLAAWKLSLEQADSAKRRDELLGELKLALDLPEPATPDAPEARVTLLGVEDAGVQLEAGARLDHVVQIRYRPEGVDDAAPIHLVQILRPLEGRAYCALGASLGDATDAATPRATYDLAFVPLVSAKAVAIEVQRATATARLSETRREYWVARGFKLRKIFDEATGHMRSTDGGATTTTVGTLTLAGDFPRRIELAETTKHGGCEVRAGDAPCDDGHADATTTTIFVYDGATYARRK